MLECRFCWYDTLSIVVTVTTAAAAAHNNQAGSGYVPFWELSSHSEADLLIVLSAVGIQSLHFNQMVMHFVGIVCHLSVSPKPRVPGGPLQGLRLWGICHQIALHSSRVKAMSS